MKRQFSGRSRIFLNLTLLAAALILAAGSAYAQYPYPTKYIGTTNLDLQHPAAMGRQIAAGGGYVHNCWTHFVGSFGQTTMHYYAYNQSNWADSVANNDVFGALTVHGGTIGFDPSGVPGGRPVLTFGELLNLDMITARATGPATGQFLHITDSSAAVTCQGIWTGSGDAPYLWPKMTLDADASGNAIAHIACVEARTGMMSLVYKRTVPGLTGMTSTCSRFIDSVGNISATILQDPNSQRVAITYVDLTRSYVYVIESPDLGSNWDPKRIVWYYKPSDIDRPAAEATGLYTADGCLHVVWPAQAYNWIAEDYNPQQCRLRHWDDCSQCVSQMYYAENWQACALYAQELNIAKVTLAECTSGSTKRLYATYTYYNGDQDGIPAPRDCSRSYYANGEIYAQVSEDQGTTWGAPVNLTNTRSPQCWGGECNSEVMPSVVPYCSDSLTLQFIVDKDAGYYGVYGAQWTNNRVMNMRVPCFSSTLFYSGSVLFTPETQRFGPATAPSYIDSRPIPLRNDGNQTLPYEVDVAYNSGSINWISFPSNPGGTGTVGVGCTSLDTTLFRVSSTILTSMNSAATVRVMYPNEQSTVDTVSIDVTQVSKPYYPTTDFVLRTPTIKLAITPEGRIGCQAPNNRFEYSDSKQFLYDGSLVIGNAPDRLSWSIYGNGPGATTTQNQFGKLLPLSDLLVDSSNSLYTKATGMGTSGDSTVGYTVDYYAPKFDDSSEFIVMHFDVYKGMNDPGGTVNNLQIAYVCDWDIPSSLLYNNSIKANSVGIVQTGQGSSAPVWSFEAGIAGYLDSYIQAPFEYFWDDERYVYPQSTIENDSAWKYISNGATYSPPGIPTAADLASTIVFARDLTINGSTADTFSFTLILASSRNKFGVGNLLKGRTFMCNYVITPELCVNSEEPCFCGDADFNGMLNVSDAVFLINYIFAGGPPPAMPCLGEADGNGVTTISDVVYLVNYIFAGGPPPPC